MLLPIQFYHPRYWPTWLALGILYLITKLPYKVQLTIGRGLGKIGYFIMRRRRHIAEVNLRRCFPELNNSQQQKLLEENFASIGIGIIEAAMAWWMEPKKIQRLAHVEGVEHVQQALTKGSGVILLSAHQTALELCAPIIAPHLAVRCIYRPQKNRLFNFFMERARARHTGGIIERDDIRTIIKSLRENMPVYYAADQDHGRQNSVFVPFFGVSAATITATARLAKTTGAAVVPGFIYRLDNNAGYRVVIYPALENFPTENIEKDTLRINQIIENAIREKPAQYLWIHRRFKTRPEGEAGFY